MLYLDGNEITTLGKNAFGKLNVLSLLSASNNLINNITVGAFENVRQLISLDLSFNNLSYVPPGAFLSMITCPYKTDYDLNIPALANYGCLNK